MLLLLQHSIERFLIIGCSAPWPDAMQWPEAVVYAKTSSRVIPETHFTKQAVNNNNNIPEEVSAWCEFIIITLSF